MPSLDAVSRSIAIRSASPESLWSLETCLRSRSRRSAASRRADHSRSSATSSPWSVYWYVARLMRPADAQVLRGREEDLHLGIACEMARDAARDCARRNATLAHRTQRDEERGGVRRASSRARADERDRVRDGRIFSHDGAHTLLSFGRAQGTRTSSGAAVLPKSTPVSCCGNSPCGRERHEEDRDEDREREREERGLASREHAIEAAAVGGAEAVEEERSTAREIFPGPRVSRGSRRSRAHIAGVTVSETAAEIEIAAPSVSAISRNRRPTMPPMKRIGSKHGEQRERDRYDREADLLASFERRVDRSRPFLEQSHDVLGDHDRVVDDEARRDGERHQREHVQAEVEEVHRRERACE